jgi:hypothetical protein
VDLNNDGIEDVITGSYTGELYIFAEARMGFRSAMSFATRTARSWKPGIRSRLKPMIWTATGIWIF